MDNDEEGYQDVLKDGLVCQWRDGSMDLRFVKGMGGCISDWSKGWIDGWRDDCLQDVGRNGAT